MSNAAATPIHSLNATQTAWLAAKGIVSKKAEGCQGLTFWNPANASSLAIYAGCTEWELEQLDRCENGEGVKLVATFTDAKSALKALVTRKQTSCGCCAKAA